MLGGLTLVCGIAGLSTSGTHHQPADARGRRYLDFRGRGRAGHRAWPRRRGARPQLLGWPWCSRRSGCFSWVSPIRVGATFLTRVTPSALMGKISAGYLLFQTLLGQACGPMLIALVSQHVFHGRNSLSGAFALCVVAFGLASALCARALHKTAHCAGFCRGPRMSVAARMGIIYIRLPIQGAVSRAVVSTDGVFA